MKRQRGADSPGRPDPAELDPKRPAGEARATGPPLPAGRAAPLPGYFPAAVPHASIEAQHAGAQGPPGVAAAAPGQVWGQTTWPAGVGGEHPQAPAQMPHVYVGAAEAGVPAPQQFAQFAQAAWPGVAHGQPLGAPPAWPGGASAGAQYGDGTVGPSNPYAWHGAAAAPPPAHGEYAAPPQAVASTPPWVGGAEGSKPAAATPPWSAGPGEGSVPGYQDSPPVDDPGFRITPPRQGRRRRRRRDVGMSPWLLLGAAVAFAYATFAWMPLDRCSIGACQIFPCDLTEFGISQANANGVGLQYCEARNGWSLLQADAVHAMEDLYISDGTSLAEADLRNDLWGRHVTSFCGGDGDESCFRRYGLVFHAYLRSLRSAGVLRQGDDAELCVLASPPSTPRFYQPLRLLPAFFWMKWGQWGFWGGSDARKIEHLTKGGIELQMNVLAGFVIVFAISFLHLLWERSARAEVDLVVDAAVEELQRGGSGSQNMQEVKRRVTEKLLQGSSRKRIVGRKIESLWDNTASCPVREALRKRKGVRVVGSPGAPAEELRLQIA